MHLKLIEFNLKLIHNIIHSYSYLRLSMYSSGADLELSERDSVPISIAPENLGCMQPRKGITNTTKLYYCLRYLLQRFPKFLHQPTKRKSDHLLCCTYSDWLLILLLL